jgi:acyl carrier protein
MTMNSLLSREQITAIKDHFAAVEITDADFNRIETIGDLIRHIEIVDTRGDNMRRSLGNRSF